MPERIQCEVRVGSGKTSRKIGTESRHLFGPAEGWWYIGMFVFAILVLLRALAWPYLYETFTGQSWRFGQAPAPVVVIQQQPTQLAPPSLPPKESNPWDDPRNR